MPLNDVWHCFLNPIAAEVRAPILDVLASAGITSPAFSSNSPPTSGIVFFDEATSAVFDFLMDVSRHHLHRLAAVSLSPAALTDEAVWGLLRSGASDVFFWQESYSVAAQLAARLERWKIIDDTVDAPLVRDNLIGQSQIWKNTLRQVVEGAQFTDTSVLITGESGTGKEMIARLIHTLDPKRSKRNLVVLDCTTVVPELSGSEFFGHERGAFTGAVSQREGAFALADGGTLFLDEVGELPLTLQAELLRVVQEHTYKRVGSNNWQRTDFRLICATNRNLIQQEQQREFRTDFYHRIAAWTCHLPPLRERVEDVIPLALHFLKKFWTGSDVPEISDTVQRYLTQRTYPGNVRELSQLIARIACRHVGKGPIRVGDIPEPEWPAAAASSEHWRDEHFERNIRRALLQGVPLKTMTNATIEIAEMLAIEDTNNNTSRAAQKLGINERTLQMHRAARRQGA